MNGRTTKVIRFMGVATSLIIGAFGALASYNLYQPPESRISGHRLDGFMLWGVPMVVIGPLLLWVVLTLPNAEPPQVIRCLGWRLKIVGGIVAALIPLVGLALFILYRVNIWVLLVLPFLVAGLPIFIVGAALETIGQKNLPPKPSAQRH